MALLKWNRLHSSLTHNAVPTTKYNLPDGKLLIISKPLPISTSNVSTVEYG